MTTPEDTNRPTPKAIAIKGTPASGEDGSDTSPKIIAKGSDLLAERLLDIAFAEGVSVRQDKDLTEILDAFDVESPIPLEALHAVSLILERVYAENTRLAGRTQDAQDTFHGPSEKHPPIIDSDTGDTLPGDADKDALFPEEPAP